MKKIILIITFFVILIFISFFAYTYTSKNKENIKTGVFNLKSAPQQAIIKINSLKENISCPQNKNEEFLTNASFSCPIGEYNVSLEREGYRIWQKKIKIEKNEIYTHEAVLFPINPYLSPLTTSGIKKIIPIEETQKMLLIIDTLKEKNGIYLFDPNKGKMSFSDEDKPIVSPIISLKDIISKIKLETLNIIFSPEKDQFILTVEALLEDETYESKSFLLSLDQQNQDIFNQEKSLEITSHKDSLIALWENQKKKKLYQEITDFFKKKSPYTSPEKIQSIATDSFKIISFSQDKTKILYQAIKDIELPYLASQSSNLKPLEYKKNRYIKENEFYVYDNVDDENFQIVFDKEKFALQNSENKNLYSNNKNNLDFNYYNNTNQDLENEEDASEEAYFKSIDTSIYQKNDIFNYVKWYPSSNHLIINENDHISVMEYDGSNKQTVYSGKYEPYFFSTNNDWKLIILTSVQKNKQYDLYEVGIR